MSPLSQSLVIGPFALSVGQLLLALSFGVALIVGALAGRRSGVPTADTLFTVILVAAAGARLVFVVRYWGSYDGVWPMLDIRDGGFDPWGGLIAGASYALWALWRSPARRTILGGALLTGALTYTLTAVPLILIEDHSRSLPDTALTTLDGEPVTLPGIAEEKARPLVVNLWATWCPPCRREMPAFELAQREEQDVVFIFVNQGEDALTIRRFLEQESLALDNILLDPHNALGRATGARAVPTTLYYDAEGRLVDTHFGEVSRATLQRGLDRLR